MKVLIVIFLIALDLCNCNEVCTIHDSKRSYSGICSDDKPNCCGFIKSHCCTFGTLSLYYSVYGGIFLLIIVFNVVLCGCCGASKKVEAPPPAPEESPPEQKSEVESLGSKVEKDADKNSKRKSKLEPKEEIKAASGIGGARSATSQILNKPGSRLESRMAGSSTGSKMSSTGSQVDSTAGSVVSEAKDSAIASSTSKAISGVESEVMSGMASGVTSVVDGMASGLNSKSAVKSGLISEMSTQDSSLKSTISQTGRMKANKIVKTSKLSETGSRLDSKLEALGPLQSKAGTQGKHASSLPKDTGSSLN